MPPQTPLPNTNPNPEPQPPTPPTPPVAPAPQPMPTPQLPPQQPVPPAAPAAPATPEPQPHMAAFMTEPTGGGQPAGGGGKSKKKIIVLAVAVAVLAAVGVGAYFAINMLAGGVALKEYSNDEYTVLVPKDYEQDEESDSVTFKEKTDDEDTQSGVEIQIEDTPDDELMSKDEFLDELAKQFEETDDADFKNIKTERITHKDQPALLVTGELLEDGKTQGEMRAVVVVGDEHTAYVIVASHVDDGGLKSRAKKITDSFEFK